MFWRGILHNFSIFWSFLTAGHFTNLFVFSMSTLKGRWKDVTSLTYCFFESEVCSLMRPFPGQWPMWKRRFLNLVGSVRSNSAWFCPRCCCVLVISGDIWWYDGVGPVWVSRESWSGINLMLSWVGLTSFTLLATELSASYVYRVVCNDCVLLLLFLLALNHKCLFVFLRFQPKKTNLDQTNCTPLSNCLFLWQGTILTSIFHHQASLNDKEVLSNLRPPGAEILHFSLAALSSFQQEWIDRTLDFMGFLTHREFWWGIYFQIILEDLFEEECSIMWTYDICRLFQVSYVCMKHFCLALKRGPVGDLPQIVAQRYPGVAGRPMVLREAPETIRGDCDLGQEFSKISIVSSVPKGTSRICNSVKKRCLISSWSRVMNPRCSFIGETISAAKQFCRSMVILSWDKQPLPLDIVTTPSTRPQSAIYIKHHHTISHSSEHSWLWGRSSTFAHLSLLILCMQSASTHESQSGNHT